MNPQAPATFNNFTTADQPTALPQPQNRPRGGDSQEYIRELLRQAGAAERRGCDVVGMEEP